MTPGPKLRGSALLAGICAADPEVTIEEAGALLAAMVIAEGAATALNHTHTTEGAHAGAEETRRPAQQHQRP